MAATPMHTANRTPIKPRKARRPIDGRWPGTWVLLTSEGRNVVSTGGTGGPTEKPDPVWVCGSEAERTASRAILASLESSSSVGATRTASDATTSKSCGSSVCFGFSVDCIGAPYSVQCHPHQGGRRIYARSTSSCPTLHSGLTKPRRYDGEYMAACGDSRSGTPPSPLSEML